MPILSQQIEAIRQEFQDISPVLDERRVRLWCAARAKAYNRQYERGGVMVVHRATGISRPRIYQGLGELEREACLPKERVRRAGGGRKKHMKNIQPCLRS